MPWHREIAAVQSCLSNVLDVGGRVGDGLFAGVIGDAPSHYSKSPGLWNAAFRHLGINACYLPFDVEDGRVGDLLDAFRRCEHFLGANVTVPHKVRVMDFLDELDPGAARIRAVNTIVRTADRRLVGYNTDGEGFIESILQRQPGRKDIFISSLKGMTALLLGAGGSARAVAFHTAEKLDGGRLIVCNRTLERAILLSSEIRKDGYTATAVDEGDLTDWAPKAGIIINSTTKGQSGIRKLAGGVATSLESYSALGPAHPPALPADLAPAEFERRWAEAANADTERNHQASIHLAKMIPPNVPFYDLIYHPEESVFLRHGRMTGHPTMNGKAMIINQAVIAFCERICRSQLQAMRLDKAQTRRQILEVMYRAW
jgi:shikimate dehydrogenase